MHSRKLGIGVIGLGVGAHHIQGFRSDVRAKVVGLCDLDNRRLTSVGEIVPEAFQTTNAAEIIRDPRIDVVSIATFDESHTQLALEAMSQGKHVFLEKPICLIRNEFEALKEMHRKTDLHLSTNFILREAPRFKQLKNDIRSGTFGQVYAVEGSYDYGRLHKLTHGWRSETPNYSVMHGGGLHLIDLGLWLADSKAVRVAAFGNQISSRGSRFKGDDYITGIIELASGATMSVKANFGSVTPHHHRMAIFGTQATFEQSHAGALTFRSRDLIASGERLEDKYPGVDKGALASLFLREILDDAPPAVTPLDVFHAMDVSLALQESLDTGGFVNVESPE